MADGAVVNSIPGATSSQPLVNNSVRKVDNVLQPARNQFKRLLLDGGLSVGSTNGGVLQPIMYRKFSAGERLMAVDLREQIRILAPKVPTLDKIDAVIRCCFVPMTYIVDNYDQMKAFRDDAGITNDDTLPIAVNSNRPQSSIYGDFTSCYAWKHKVASFFTCNSLGSGVTVDLSIVRAYFAMRDWFCRVKNYQPKLARFTQQEPTQTEIDAVLGTFDSSGEPILNGLYGDIQRDCIRSDYYANLRPRIQSLNNTTVPMNNPSLASMAQRMFLQVSNATIPTPWSSNANIQQDPSAITPGNVSLTPTAPIQGSNGTTFPSPELMSNQVAHIDWQSAISELRRRQTSSIKNDPDEVADMGSCRPVRTDRPEYLGEKVVSLNYQQITATANSSDTSLGNAPLGTAGAYSLTESQGIMDFQREFLQDGVLIFTLTITSPMVPEQGIHRTALMKYARDFYNPHLATQQIDVMKPQELNGQISASSGIQNFGFKPKYSEHDTLPNLCIRDCRSSQLKTKGSTLSTPLYLGTLNSWHSMLQDPNYGGNSNVATGSYFADKTDIILSRNSRVGVANTYSNDLVLFGVKFDMIIDRPIVPVNEKFASDKPGTAV